MTLNKWQELLNSVEFSPDFNLKPIDREVIDNCEAELGIKFPEDYKDYCQVFGEVDYGKEIAITTADVDTVRNSRQQCQDILDSYEEGDYSKSGWANVLVMRRVSESGFVFGSSPNAIDFGFDLSTYSEIDKSCDIYMIYYCDGDPIIWNIGRDFYSFIKDCCLGTKLDGDSVPRRMIKLLFPRILSNF
jgi:SMI1-KNR4 cell-wall